MGTTFTRQHLCHINCWSFFARKKHKSHTKFTITIIVTRLQITSPVFFSCSITFQCIFLFLQHYTRTGEILCKDVIKHIGAKMFISPRLVFLVKYYDFQNYHQAQQYGAAAELLINLLDSKIAPAYFWPSMFADTFSLLEASEPIFSSKETQKIMHYLENNLYPLLENLRRALKSDAHLKRQAIAEWEPLLTKATNLQKSNDGDQSDISLIDNISFMIKIIRLACVRNLSRSIIFENTAI